MIYYYVFVVYLFIGFLFFLDLSEKIETIMGQNLFDHIALQMGTKPNIFFKLQLVICVMLVYPLVLVIAVDKNKLDNFKETLDELKSKIDKSKNV
jgi:uncharacterized membrane protein (DUF106 family)